MKRVQLLLAVLNLAFGITAIGSATYVHQRFSAAIRDAAQATERAIAELRSNIVQLRVEVEKLPETLKASEQATQSTAGAIRQVQSGIPVMLSQVDSLAKTIADLNPKFKELSVDLRKTAKGLDWLSSFDAVKGGQATLTTFSDSLDLVAPQFLETGNVLSKQTRDLKAPLKESLGRVAGALDSVASQTASLRTGVITGLPSVLENLAKSLESYLQPLKTVPVVINAFCLLLFSFGLCFVGISVKQLNVRSNNSA